MSKYFDKNGKPLNEYLTFVKDNYKTIKQKVLQSNPNTPAKDVREAVISAYYESVHKSRPTTHPNKSSCRRLSEEDCIYNEGICKWSAPTKVSARTGKLTKPHCIGIRSKDSDRHILQGPINKLKK